MNSDKNSILERRRIELLNAIKHEAGAENVTKRIHALKQAVLGVAKKHNVRSRPFTPFADNLEWQDVVRYWENLAPNLVIAIVAGWSDRPKYREVRLACRNAVDDPTQDNSQSLA